MTQLANSGVVRKYGEYRSREIGARSRFIHNFTQMFRVSV